MARLSRGSRWFLGVVVLLFVGAAAALYLIDSRIQPLFTDDVEAGQPVELEVAPGTSVRAVGEQLEELGVVRSALRFRLDAESADLAASLRPGTFALETGMSNADAIDVLAAGPTGGLGGTRFTVPEGLTIAQTIARLDAQFDDLDADDFRDVLDARLAAGSNVDGVLQLPEWFPEPSERGDDVLEPFEGVLFPQTYDVGDGADALQVLQRMVDQLVRVADRLEDADLAALEERGLTRYEGLIVASLVERETRVDAEREQVSGVIAGRRRDGMRLDIDATAQYAAGDPSLEIAADVDTSIDSPYNTYRIDGLPPTPIAGVGEASFFAAHRPADTDARYYVLDPACDGSHRFAATLDEHNRNVRAFREEGDRCRGAS